MLTLLPALFAYTVAFSLPAVLFLLERQDHPAALALLGALAVGGSLLAKLPERPTVRGVLLEHGLAALGLALLIGAAVLGSWPGVLLFVALYALSEGFAVRQNLRRLRRG